MTVLDSVEWTRCLAHGRRRAMSRPQRIRSLLTRLQAVQQTTFTAVDTEAHPTLGAEQASDSLRGGQFLPEDR